MSSQNYSNHRRYVPSYHFFLYSVVLACLVGASDFAYNAFVIQHHYRVLAATIFGLAIISLLTTFFSRSFSLKAQDRGIRSEENLRHFALTGKVLDKRLRMSQIVALRFADDAEFVALSARAANENMKPEDIKKAIVNWKADHHRI